MSGVRIDQALVQATQQLEGHSPSPRLDAEVLLSHMLQQTRTWLYTWADRALTQGQVATFDTLIERRRQGEPVAYLTGEREFWGMVFSTHHDTLIPRPDTELLVEAALASAAADQGRLLDMGTGTGAVALAFASERPRWAVTGIDIMPNAVQLARQNAARLALDHVHFVESNWFSGLDPQHAFDIIVSNPPYLADDDVHLDEGDVRFEPRSALVSGAEGLDDLRYLVTHAGFYLSSSGWLMLEHGYLQGEPVRQVMESAGYHHVKTLRDLAGHERVTLGYWHP